jgi:hypothetical protein
MQQLNLGKLECDVVLWRELKPGDVVTINEYADRYIVTSVGPAGLTVTRDIKNADYSILDSDWLTGQKIRIVKKCSS